MGSIFRSGRYLFIAAAIVAGCVFTVSAEDGYHLWMRYGALPERSIAVYRARVRAIVVGGNSATSEAIRSELSTGLDGLLGEKLPVEDGIIGDGSLIVGTPENSPDIASLKLEWSLAQLPPDGFVIRSARIRNRRVTVIASRSETG